MVNCRQIGPKQASPDHTFVSLGKTFAGSVFAVSFLSYCTTSWLSIYGRKPPILLVAALAGLGRLVGWGRKVINRRRNCGLYLAPAEPREGFANKDGPINAGWVGGRQPADINGGGGSLGRTRLRRFGGPLRTAVVPAMAYGSPTLRRAATHPRSLLNREFTGKVLLVSGN